MKRRPLLVFLATTGLVTPAFAHAFLQHANPGAGETLAIAPREISLQFTEKLEPIFSGAEVADASGHDVEAAHTAINGDSMHILLKPLAPGRYRVSWHAVSVDTHRTEGAYAFTVKP